VDQTGAGAAKQGLIVPETVMTTPKTGAPAPLGWPFAAPHGLAAFGAAIAAAHGRTADWRILEAPGMQADLMVVRRSRPLSLDCRFDFLPRDRRFVRVEEKRLIPLRQVSPRISLEAGNLRGGYRFDGPAQDLPRALFPALASGGGGWDLGNFPIPRDHAGAWCAAARAAGLGVILRESRRFFSARIAVADFDTMLAGASRNHRRTVQRALRAVEEAGASLTLYRAGTLEIGLMRLKACADRSWKADETADLPVRVPVTDARLAFLRAVQASGEAEVAVATVERDDETLAAASWLRSGGTLIGGDMIHIPAARPLSPGHAMLAASLRSTLGEGIEIIDFNATSEWIRGYTDTVSEFATLLVFPRTPLGRLAHAMARWRDPGVPCAGKDAVSGLAGDHAG
jgi:hypothetical protein